MRIIRRPTRRRDHVRSLQDRVRRSTRVINQPKCIERKTKKIQQSTTVLAYTDGITAIEYSKQFKGESL